MARAEVSLSLALTSNQIFGRHHTNNENSPKGLELWN